MGLVGIQGAARGEGGASGEVSGVGGCVGEGGIGFLKERESKQFHHGLILAKCNDDETEESI